MVWNNQIQELDLEPSVSSYVCVRHTFLLYFFSQTDSLNNLLLYNKWPLEAFHIGLFCNFQED